MDNISKSLSEIPEKQSTGRSNYVSCIKIDGVPILPPLLNDKDRAEMRRYKELAIDVQKRLSQIKSEYISDSSFTDTDILDDNFSSDTSTGSFFTDMSVEDSTVKFSESCHRDVIKMLEDRRNGEKNVELVVSPLETPAITHVPLCNQDISESSRDNGNSSENLEKPIKRSPIRQLSHTLESFEKVFSDDVLKSLACVDNENCDNDISKLDKKNNNLESSDENYSTANEAVDKTPKKLIRSNSFILEKPSPMLIAQIERENSLNATKESSPPKRKTWNTSESKNLFIDNKGRKSPKNIEIVNKNTSEFQNKNLNVDSQVKIPQKIENQTKTLPERSEKPSPKNTSTSQQKRRGWDLTNAREKWSSIENDLGKSNTRRTPKKFSSLPPSTSGSPNGKMFNSTMLDAANIQAKLMKNELSNNEKLANARTCSTPFEATNRSKNVTPEKKNPNAEFYNTQSNKNINIIGVKAPISDKNSFATSETNKNRSTTPEKQVYSFDSLKRTPEKYSTVPKKIMSMSTPKKFTQYSAPDMQKRILRGCITPIRATRDVPSREFSPKRVRSAPRPLKPQRKTDMLLRSPNFTLFKPQSPYYFVSEQDKNIGDSTNTPSVILPEKDIKVLFEGNNNFESERSLNTFTSRPNDESLISNLSSSSKTDLKDLFSKMQEIQAKQMADLMERQKQEQELFLKKFAEQQAMLLTKITEVYSSPESNKSDGNETNLNNTPSVGNDLIKNSETLLTECRKLLDNNNSQSCDKLLTPTSSHTLYAFNSSNDTLADPNLTLRTDTATEPSVDEITIKYLSSPCNNKDYHVVTMAEFKRSMSDDSLEAAAHLTNSLYNGNKMVATYEKNITVCVDQRNEKRRNSCSRALFPSDDQIHAANIICAAAKGYLVRRLLKSERVQNLIQTIKDTLLCAMDLHHETVENIQPSDIELHRRLIQQVTAACVSFHDMFFKLTIREQMAVISQDRERQKEKLLRPVSARSSSLTSTTQKVLERKLRRDSSVDLSSSSNSRSSFSRSCHTEHRTRTRSVGPSDSHQYKKTPPLAQDTSMRRSMGYGANKKPWR